VRTLNVRLAIILVVILIVGGAGVYFIHSMQQYRNATFFLEQAKIAKHDLEDAKKEKKTEEQQKALQMQEKNLQWYLSFRPNDMEVMEELGLLFADNIVDGTTFNQIAFNQAIGLLDKVVTEDPTRKDARRKLIELLMLRRSYTDALEHLKYLLAESPDNPELLQLLGQCQEATREYENAQKSYEKAIEYSLTQIDTYPRLANLLRQSLEKPKEAYDCMQNLVKNNPDSSKAYIYLGTYWDSMEKEEAKQATGNDDIDPKEEALKAAEKAVELSPDDQDALLLAARCAIASDKPEQARKYTEHNLEIHKDSPTIYTTLAEIIVRAGDKEKAIEILNRGLKETKNSPQILWYKVNFLIDLRNLDEAREAIKQLQTTQYPKSMTDYLEARMAFAQKHWSDSAERFEKVRSSLISMPNLLKQTDLSLGYCYGQLHSVDQQINAYQRVIKIDPFSTVAREGLTDALVASGRVDDAVQQWATLIKTAKMPASAVITFANLLIRQNMQRSAIEQKWDQVEKVIDEAEKVNPDSEQIPLLRAEVFHAQNRNSEAEKVLQKANQKYPKQVEFWKAMVNMASLQKNWNQAEKILADYEKQLGDTADLRLARCEYLLQRYDAKAGEHLVKLGENIDAFSEPDKVRLWNGLLNAARRSGDTKLTKQYVDLLAQKDVNNLDVHFLRLEQAANNQDLAALEEALKDVKKVEKEGPLWLFGQARLLAVRAAKEKNPALLDEALQNLIQARELRSTWSRIPLFMGTIYDQQNKPEQALKCYTDAIELGERNPAAARRAVAILVQKQRYKDADNLLKQLERQQLPFTPELTRLWVQLLFQQGEFDMAVAKARQVVTEKSDDYKEQIWLGQILGVAARRAKAQKNDKEFASLSAEAEKSLRRAVELKSDAPEAWVPLVEFLSSMDKGSAAEEVIDKARSKIPADKAPIALGQCYEAVEKNDLAMEQYKLALAAKPNDPDIIRNVADFYQRIGKTVEAEALLRLIVDGKVKAEDANLFWARRQLALLTAAKGGLLNMEAARKLIQQNLAATANSPEELRIIVKFDIADPRKSAKDEAIDILNKMMDGQQATPEDRFNLAVLYLATEKQMQAHPSAESNADAGNKKDVSAWVKASKILRDLIVSQESEPRYLAIYVNALLEHGDVSSAELYMNQLIKNFSNTAATIVLRSQILVRKNQFDEALELMKSFVDMKNAVPPDRSKRIRMMAETMEQMTDRMKGPDQKSMAEHYIRTAEMFYRQYVDEHPSQSMDLVMFFIRQGQIDDAVNILETTWQNCEPITVGQVCMNIIQSEKKSKEITQRVEKVLTDAREKFENHPAILLTLGDIRVSQDRFAEAESFYRQILEKYPEHSVAMNNLAVLLTLQGNKLDEALSLINKAIERSGHLASMIDTRACVYIAQGNAEKAIKDIDEAVADGATPIRLFHQAQALNLAKQKYAASSAMQQALKAGLTKENLQSLEIPAFEKLRSLAGELGNAPDAKKGL
jgi:tetratricopeptide (TPR) repeat protein